ncbi:MAG: hypothetical protein PHE02_06715 [Lachnospiraceae bacterium]|nr:hypothetical protein [Lachnospiraceae bacterium]
MKFWNRLFKRKKAVKTNESEWDENPVLRREDIDMHNPAEREKYVRSCLEQIEEASRETDELAGEYAMVTSYLTDMEEVEALPLEEKKMIAEQAGKVVNIIGEQKRIQTSSNRMSDTDYKHMERIQDDMPEGYEKLKNTEEYQELVRNDLKRLSGERHAYYYRRNELRNIRENTRGIVIITLVAMMTACIILLILQMSLYINVKVGYLLTVGLGALALTYLYVKYMDSSREQKKVEQGINKLILLQNRVKIRYVNNTNLLDYYYMKYGIDSSQHLKELWDVFLVEREERAKIEKANEELDFYSGGLISMLSSYHIKDPAVWIRQAEALLDDKEMVEIRHNLITRRQALRKQMEYNKQIADAAHREVKDLVVTYPKYAQEILAIVSEY